MFASTLCAPGSPRPQLLPLALTGSALAAQPSQRKPTDAAPPWATSGFDSGAAAALAGRSGFARQHGGEADHLPAVRENIELVGKLRVDTPAQYRTPEHNKPVEEGQIADLAIYKQAAYLNSWAEPVEADEACHRGGFFSADISDPAHPRQLAFVPALPGTYHGEGAHVVTFNGRDILAVNNEPCAENGVGGFDLYDVTNPADPDTPGAGRGRPVHGLTRRASAWATRRRSGRRCRTARTRSSCGRTAASSMPSPWTTRSFMTSTSSTSRTRRRRSSSPTSTCSRSPTSRASSSSTTGGQRHDLPPRHGRQEDRQRPDHARLVLGRRLRQAQRQRPRLADVHRRFGLRGHRPAASRRSG